MAEPGRLDVFLAISGMKERILMDSTTLILGLEGLG